MAKKPEGKAKLRYVYPSCMEAIARVREYGTVKHGTEEGWRTTNPIEHAEAALRHILKWMEGEKNDEPSNGGSGLNHLAHAMCNLMFEIERDSAVHQRWEELIDPELLELMRKEGRIN